MKRRLEVCEGMTRKSTTRRGSDQRCRLGVYVSQTQAWNGPGLWVADRLGKAWGMMRTSGDHNLQCGVLAVLRQTNYILVVPIGCGVDDWPRESSSTCLWLVLQACPFAVCICSLASPSHTPKDSKQHAFWRNFRFPHYSRFNGRK